MQWGGKTYFLLAIVRRIDEVLNFPFVIPVVILGTNKLWPRFRQRMYFLLFFLVLNLYFQ